MIKYFEGKSNILWDSIDRQAEKTDNNYRKKRLFAGMKRFCHENSEDIFEKCGISKI